VLLDFVGTFTSLLSTYLFVRINSKAWLVTLLSSCLNGVLYWQNSIYASTVLESCYFISTCYGWYMWCKPIKKEELAISSLSVLQWFWVLVVILVFYTIIISLLSTFAHSDVAILDALTTSISLVAQWLMCHKVIATWILWFSTDALYVYVYLQKQMPFHCLLMFIYTGMAIAGYLTWAKIRNVHEITSATSAQTCPNQVP
jgi:nicotinamide mononucleotide transporter